MNSLTTLEHRALSKILTPDGPGSVWTLLGSRQWTARDTPI